MVATPEEIRVTAEEMQKRLISTSASVQDAVAKLWDQYANDGWLTGVDREGTGGTADQFIAEAARIIDAGALAVAQTGDQWLANLADVPPGTLDFEQVVGGIRRGTPTEEVLARAIKRARILHYAKQTDAEAFAGGKTRALAVAGTNVPYAMRQTAQAFGIAHGVAGWRRRPNPGACMFCMMASTQRYRTGALMPMHTNCHCIPMPILGTSDPGRVIDKQGLALLKQAAKDGTKVVVNEHGELGPMLGKAGDNFTNEDELQAFSAEPAVPVNVPRKKTANEELAVSVARGRVAKETEAFESVLPTVQQQAARFPKPSLSDAERKAVDDYIRGQWRDLNEYLRNGPKEWWAAEGAAYLKSKTDPLDAWRDSLNAAIRKSTVPVETVTYRGLGGFPPPDELLQNMKPGTVFRDEAFTSTTLNPVVAGRFGSSAIFSIRIPQGTPGLSMASVDDGRIAQTEGEVLLPTGSRFRVVAVDNTDGFYFVELEYLPE